MEYHYNCKGNQRESEIDAVAVTWVSINLGEYYRIDAT